MHLFLISLVKSLSISFVISYDKLWGLLIFPGIFFFSVSLIYIYIFIVSFILLFELLCSSLFLTSWFECLFFFIFSHSFILIKTFKATNAFYYFYLQYSYCHFFFDLSFLDVWISFYRSHTLWGLNNIFINLKFNDMMIKKCDLSCMILPICWSLLYDIIHSMFYKYSLCVKRMNSPFMQNMQFYMCSLNH